MEDDTHNKPEVRVRVVNHVHVAGTDDGSILPANAEDQHFREQMKSSMSEQSSTQSIENNNSLLAIEGEMSTERRAFVSSAQSINAWRMSGPAGDDGRVEPTRATTVNEISEQMHDCEQTHVFEVSETTAVHLQLEKDLMVGGAVDSKEGPMRIAFRDDGTLSSSGSDSSDLGANHSLNTIVDQPKTKEHTKTKSTSPMLISTDNNHQLTSSTNRSSPPNCNQEGAFMSSQTSSSSKRIVGSLMIDVLLSSDQSTPAEPAAAVASSVLTTDNGGPSLHPAETHFVIVAIDFGTTMSGYAFSFVRDPSSIHMMRKWEGGDPGVINQKTPTTLLLSPEGDFHSFGFTARDFYHDLDNKEAKRWLYFEKFKMALHYNAVS